MGAVGREEGSRAEGTARVRDQGMGWKMITADYCVATVHIVFVLVSGEEDDGEGQKMQP